MCHSAEEGSDADAVGDDTRYRLDHVIDILGTAGPDALYVEARSVQGADESRSEEGALCVDPTKTPNACGQLSRSSD